MLIRAEPECWRLPEMRRHPKSREWYKQQMLNLNKSYKIKGKSIKDIVGFTYITELYNKNSNTKMGKKT